MTLAIAPLGNADLAWAMELVSSAGWNQQPADWKRLIDYERDGCFKALINDTPVGTVTTTRYGNELAWIGMMLVDPSFRRRGIGLALMQAALQYLRQREVCTIKLDATPLGRPLYEKLGFRVEWDFQRWTRVYAENPHAPAGATTNASLDESALVLDRTAFGVDRRQWLQQLAPSGRVASSSCGFAMLRPGRIATTIGPIVARDCTTADQLLQSLLTTPAGSYLWDVPGPNADAARLAQQREFQTVRTLHRMWMGEYNVECSLQNQFAIADPATG